MQSQDDLAGSPPRSAWLVVPTTITQRVLKALGVSRKKRRAMIFGKKKPMQKPTQKDDYNLQLEADLYFGVRRSDNLDLEHEGALFVVRQWDGMDECWIDLTKPCSAKKALTMWNMHTDRGTKWVSYSEIDYYRIFPAESIMGLDGGREIFRSP